MIICLDRNLFEEDVDLNGLSLEEILNNNDFSKFLSIFMFFLAN